MKKCCLFCLLGFITACGYTTRGFVYREKGIFIKPVANAINITSESREYSSYTTFPILLEKQLTNALVNRFNTDGNLSVASDRTDALELICIITHYVKDALRYSDSDDVTEQRLKLHVDLLLYDSGGDVLKEKKVVGETTYFLSGTLAKSEAAAKNDLIDDTARRIVEAVVENW